MKRRIGPVGLTCGLLLSGALWAGEARGSAPVRYTTVFESWVEDRAEPRSAVESALMAAMLKAGATCVDEAQSRRLRSLASAGELLDGAIPEVITSLDADVILAAVVRSRPANALLLGQNLEGDSYPMRMQQIDYVLLQQQLPWSLYPAVLYQQQASDFIPHYQPVVMPPEKHRGYALQWFGLAIAVLGVGLATSWQREKNYEQE